VALPLVVAVALDQSCRPALADIIGAHRDDDLLGVDSLQVDAGRAEIGMAELALDDVQRNALAGEFERVGVAALTGA
jgi:hypothetical protein